MASQLERTIWRICIFKVKPSQLAQDPPASPATQGRCPQEGRRETFPRNPLVVKNQYEIAVTRLQVISILRRPVRKDAVAQPGDERPSHWHISPRLAVINRVANRDSARLPQRNRRIAIVVALRNYISFSLAYTQRQRRLAHSILRILRIEPLPAVKSLIAIDGHTGIWSIISTHLAISRVNVLFCSQPRSRSPPRSALQSLRRTWYAEVDLIHCENGIAEVAARDAWKVSLMSST